MFKTIGVAVMYQTQIRDLTYPECVALVRAARRFGGIQNIEPCSGKAFDRSSITDDPPALWYNDKQRSTHIQMIEEGK
jgi:hypothetical protein